MASPQPIRLLIATGNTGKMREYSELLADLPFELVSLKDLGITHEVDETGETFEENAWLKASEYAALSGLLTLADDSGLEVDALDGEPGVRSARYGGDACVSDNDRVNLLLENLKDVPWEERTARFRCVIAIAVVAAAEIPLPSPFTKGGSSSPPFIKGGQGGFRSSGGDQPTLVTQAEGSVDGMIQYNPQGDDGFGYDPVFYIPSHDKTMAQISLDEKNKLSHRGNAAKIAVESLKKLTADN
ncbi:MAG: non-canonical purine NTP pyrophosphatase [Chloroflexi bacterium]|nr:non-canonical purine NTP pyrophosphatase [Chloroflexota bacterium]